MFFKDDANNDPQWSEEQLIAAKFCFAGLVIGQAEVDIMRYATQANFDILEKSWLPQNSTLVDMKIEFGVDVTTEEIVLADVIDNDSWTLANRRSGTAERYTVSGPQANLMYVFKDFVISCDSCQGRTWEWRQISKGFSLSPSIKRHLLDSKRFWSQEKCKLTVGFQIFSILFILLYSPKAAGFCQIAQDENKLQDHERNNKNTQLPHGFLDLQLRKGTLKDAITSREKEILLRT
ncbi:hypothetical protein STEG23_001823 [Scotinomys teguina]